MRSTYTTIGLPLALAAALSLGACGSNTEQPSGGDAMASSASNEAMMSSEGGDAMKSGDAMASGAMSSDNAMAADGAMASGDAMASGGNDAMASGAPPK